jgi:branched-chain amino acid transport system substrate-binding protein
MGTAPIGGARRSGRSGRRSRATMLVMVAVAALAAPVPVVGGPEPAAAATVERADGRASVEARCRRKPDRCLRIGVGEPVVIGTLLDETQPLGREPLVSVQLAIDYLDGTFDGVDGSLLGHPVVLITGNEGCDRNVSRLAQSELLSEDALVAVIGTTCSSAALGQADVAFSQARIPIVSPSNTAPALTDPDTHERYYFRVSWNDKIQGAVMANFAASRGWRGVAVVAQPDDPYSDQLAGAVASQARRRQIGIRTVPWDATDPARTIAALVADPRPIVLTLLPPQCREVAAAIRREPVLAGQPLLVSEACGDRDFLRALGPDPGELYAAVPDTRGTNETRAFYRESFVPAFTSRVGTGPTVAFHAQAFDAAQLIFSAIRRSSVGQPGGELLIERKRLRDALLRISGYPGISGVVTCAPSGDCADQVAIGVYRAPDWPAVVGPSAAPVFSQSLTLGDLEAN